MTAEEFLALADLLPEPTLLVGLEGDVVAGNRAACQLLGCDPDRLAGSSLADHVIGDHDSLKRYLKDCARNRQLLPGAFAWSSDSGKTLELRVDGGGIPPRGESPGGRVLLRLRSKERATDRFSLLNRRIEALSREITRRRQIEHQLEAQRRWLEITLASIADAVIATDHQGKVLLMNRVAETLTGWSGEQAIGQPLDQIFQTIDETTRQPRDPVVSKVLDDGTASGLSNHILLLGKDGREISIENSAAPIRDGDGTMIGAVLIFRDAGERRRIERERAEVLMRERSARERAEAADQTKDEFLATLSHELRAPLQAIGNWVYLLKTQTLDRLATTRALDTIERNLELEVRLVDDLLQISHLVAGQIRLETRSLDLATLVHEVVDQLRDTIEARGLELELELAPRSRPVCGDPLRLRQVLWHLLSNALKFTPEGGRIQVRLESDVEGDKTRLIVSDSGEGIEAEAMPYIFDRFRQADASRTRSHSGLGLGLAIASRLIELHGGTLKAESPGAGKGATFVITLPALGEELEDGAGLTLLAGRLILIVTKDSETRELTQKIFLRFGAVAMIAASAEEALAATAEVAPEAIVCDLSCEGLDCDSLLRDLRARDAGHGQRAVAIALTGSGGEDGAATATGFDGWLAKPVEPQRIARTVAELLRSQADRPPVSLSR